MKTRKNGYTHFMHLWEFGSLNLSSELGTAIQELEIGSGTATIVAIYYCGIAAAARMC